MMIPHFHHQFLQKKVKVKIVLIMKKLQSFILILKKENWTT